MKNKLCVMLVFISTTFSAYAEDNTAFTQLVDKLRQHPEIQAYVQKADSARYYARGELGLPDPMLFIEEQDYPIGNSMSAGQEQKMVGFRQEIPRPAIRKAKSDRLGIESQKNILLADYAFAAMKAKLITTLADLQKIRLLKSIAKEQQQLFTSQKTSLKGAIAADKTGISSLTMTEAESVDVSVMLADLEEEEHEHMAMLINMIGEATGIPLPAITMKRWDHDAGVTYPVQIAAVDMDMARKDIDLRKGEFGPDFEVQAGYGRMRGGDNAGTVMLGVSIPLWAKQNQLPKLKGAEASYASSKSDLENVKRQTTEKLTHLQVQIMASSKKLELLKTKISLLKQSTSAMTREYEAGKVEFSMPLKIRRDMLSAKVMLVTEQARKTALIADFNRYIAGEEK